MNCTTDPASQGDAQRHIAEWAFAAEAGAAQAAADWAAEVVRPLWLSGARLERLAAAVTEAVANALEHQQRLQTLAPICVRVTLSSAADEAGQPDAAAAVPAGHGGWGFYVVEQPARSAPAGADGSAQIIELVIYLESTDKIEMPRPSAPRHDNIAGSREP